MRPCQRPDVLKLECFLTQARLSACGTHVLTKGAKTYTGYLVFAFLAILA